MGNYDVSEIEAEIARLRGILSVKATLGPGGELDEIYVLADHTRNPKQLVRDIEAVCATRFKTRVDYRKVSVAQVETQEEPMPQGMGICPGRVRVAYGNGEFEAEVELILGETRKSATARGPGTEGNRLRILAIATLRALGLMTGNLCAASLEEALIVHVKGGKAAVVLLTLALQGSEEGLLGVSPVRRDEGEAVVRACLDAVGRRLMLMSGTPEKEDGGYNLEDALASDSAQEGPLLDRG